MDPFGNDEIARLLRLKRYEQPPASYYENFLSEFRRRQRDELLRQPVWRICFERAHGFALRHNVRPYPAGVAQELRQKLTGHASAEMNAQYTHHELESLRAAVSVIPSIGSKL